MNTRGKTLVSFLILVCYAMMAAGSNSDEYPMYIFILIFVFLGGYALSKNEKEKAARRAELAKEARAEKENENVQKLEELKVLFGEPTKVINYSHCKYFLLNEENSQLMINEHIYKFRDVIDFNISDNSTVIYTPTTSITSTNTGNALTRAVVGGVLTGGVGAIIGGTTGSKTTITKGGESYTSHNYSILITVDSLTNPIEKIELRSDEEITNTIAAILTIIVSRNQRMQMSKLLLLIIFVFSSCTFTKQKENQIQSHINSIDTISLIDNKEKILKKDSIDTLIELRSRQYYEGNLFAKMKFGDSRSICKQKLNIYDEHFKHRIYIPKDSTFRFFDIGEIRPSYYNDQLYKLEIFFDGYGAYSDLEKMFTSKYGKTKDGIWKYRNAEISVDCESRTPVVYPYGNSNVYYGGYRVRNGGPGSSVTKESSYYVISYLNYHLQELLQKEEALKDSLNEVKRLKEFQEEMKKVDNQQEFI